MISAKQSLGLGTIVSIQQTLATSRILITPLLGFTWFSSFWPTPILLLYTNFISCSLAPTFYLGILKNHSVWEGRSEDGCLNVCDIPTSNHELLKGRPLFYD